ncbi:MAG: hypothetical protein WB565_13315 [Acidimicrobiales bacterium]
MSREVVPLRTSLIRYDRSLERIDRQTDVQLALVQQQVETETAKVDGALRVAGKAAQGVAVLSQIEQQLTETVPTATSRVAFVVDRTVLEIGEMVTDACYRLRHLR